MLFRSETIADATIPDDFITKQDKSKVVNVLTVVLLHIHPIHVHQNVADHHHGGLVVGPGHVQGVQKVVVEARQNISSHLGLQMAGDHFLKAVVKPFTCKFCAPLSMHAHEKNIETMGK